MRSREAAPAAKERRSTDQSDPARERSVSGVECRRQQFARTGIDGEASDDGRIALRFERGGPRAHEYALTLESCTPEVLRDWMRGGAVPARQDLITAADSTGAQDDGLSEHCRRQLT